jgi:hypothetical protein
MILFTWIWQLSDCVAERDVIACSRSRDNRLCYRHLRYSSETPTILWSVLKFRLLTLKDFRLLVKIKSISFFVFPHGEIHVHFCLFFFCNDCSLLLNCFEMQSLLVFRRCRFFRLLYFPNIYLITHKLHNSDRKKKTHYTTCFVHTLSSRNLPMLKGAYK